MNSRLSGYWWKHCRPWWPTSSNKLHIYALQISTKKQNNDTLTENRNPKVTTQLLSLLLWLLHLCFFCCWCTCVFWICKAVWICKFVQRVWATTEDNRIITCTIQTSRNDILQNHDMVKWWSADIPLFGCRWKDLKRKGHPPLLMSQQRISPTLRGYERELECKTKFRKHLVRKTR